MKNTNSIIEHKHFDMGKAPYKLVGIWSSPSKASQEVNPSAYNVEMAARPKSCTHSCACCSTGIVHHFIIRDADKKEFAVGSTCIDKLNDTRLTTAAKLAENKRKKALRAIAAEKKREEQRKAEEIELEAERARNGGLTDGEIVVEHRKSLKEELLISVGEIFSPIGSALNSQNGNFVQSILSDVYNEANLPGGSAKNIIIEIMTKKAGRANSKAYKAQYPINEKSVNDIFERVAELKSNYQTALEATYYN
jgi:hypothetical protein